jgi:hypothetical protein
MQALVMARWLLLGLALGCGVVLALALFTTNILPQGAPLDAIMLAAPVLQAAGVFAAARASRPGRWAVVAGYLAAVCFAIAYLASGAAVAAGPGELVYGLLILMPAGALALLLQIAALFGFARSERRSG